MSRKEENEIVKESVHGRHRREGECVGGGDEGGGGEERRR